MEMVRAQNQNIELERLLSEFSKQDQKVTEELKEKSEMVARLEVEVVELKRTKPLPRRRPLRSSILE